MSDRPDVALFNVSAPLPAILSQVGRSRIVLRVDALYFDRCSAPFIDDLPRLARPLIQALSRLGVGDDLANLLNQNYGGFARIALADYLVYQSEFGRNLYARYFPWKRGCVILNAARARFGERKLTRTDGHLRIVAVFGHKLSKRIGLLIRFARWANEIRRRPTHLTLLGFEPSKGFTDLDEEEQKLARTRSYIECLPPFDDYIDREAAILAAADAYVSFSYRDCCPNSVIEALSFGVPVISPRSGGVAEIVGDAGVLLDFNDSRGYFCAHRYERDFPPIDFDAVLSAAEHVSAKREEYLERAKMRFHADLDIRVAARRYRRAVREAAQR